MHSVLFLALLALSSALICVEVEPSYLASASDCVIAKLNENTLQWSAVLTFSDEVSHRSDNWFNLLADMEHPRLPFFPVGSKCSSQYGTFSSGQSVSISCTQSFEDIPRDYVNAVYVLEDSHSPFGFSIKLPLGILRGNLSSE